MLRLAVWLRRFAMVALLSAGLTSALAQVPGKDFQPVNPPQPTENAGKVEVIEFFSYACPHCESMEPSMSAWLKRKPPDVDFKRVPAVFQDSWLPFARIYYTIDAMGLVDKLHHEVFAAIHKQKVRLQDPKVLFDWVATKGVDRKKFEETYNSFAVQSLTQRAPDITRRYNVPFTPSIVVDGRYLTGPSMTSTGNAVDYDRFYKVLDQMIASERNKKKPASK
jgi:thiol:disulfide interchange protein DsbA